MVERRSSSARSTLRLRPSPNLRPHLSPSRTPHLRSTMQSPTTSLTPADTSPPLAAAGVAAAMVDDEDALPARRRARPARPAMATAVRSSTRPRSRPCRPSSPRARARPKTPVKTDDRITREEVVPSWELTDRYGAQSSGRGDHESSGGGDGTFSKILTAVAVVIILALGVAAVVLVPGLLNGSPGQHAPPSLALASRSPLATSVAGVETPTVAPATPDGHGRTHGRGHTRADAAHLQGQVGRHHRQDREADSSITVAALMAANPRSATPTTSRSARS